jgi:hypothetical protein
LQVHPHLQAVALAIQILPRQPEELPFAHAVVGAKT